MRPQPTILVIPLNVSDTMLPRMLCLYNESHKEGIQTTTITTITTTTNYRQIICLARVFETAAGQSPSVSRPAAAPMLWLTSRAGREQEVNIFSKDGKTGSIISNYLFYPEETLSLLESQGVLPREMG